MKVHYHKKFLKQLSKLPHETRGKIEQFVFDELPKTVSIQESGKIEKMSGYKNYFKVRFGSYRIGLKSEDNILVVQIVMHRRDIYKYFP